MGLKTRIFRAYRHGDKESVCINRPVLVLVDALGFLGVKDQNEIRLPVVNFLASQRASSIQTLVNYFIAVRLVLVHRISLQHCRPVDYVQEPNAEPASSRRNFLGETDRTMCSYCGLLIGNLDAKPLSSASRALWPGGSDFVAQGSGRPPPRRAWRRPRYPFVGLCGVTSALLVIREAARHGYL
jgi:hypothetical protein